MRIKAVVPPVAVVIALAAAGSAQAGAPAAGCQPGWTLTPVNGTDAALQADRNGDGLICVSQARETPNFTFRAVTDNRFTA